MSLNMLMSYLMHHIHTKIKSLMLNVYTGYLPVL